MPMDSASKVAKADRIRTAMAAVYDRLQVRALRVRLCAWAAPAHLSPG